MITHPNQSINQWANTKIHIRVCTQRRWVTTQLVTSQMFVADSHLSYYKLVMTSTVARPLPKHSCLYHPHIIDPRYGHSPFHIWSKYSDVGQF
jgi:hypothetical protein